MAEVVICLVFSLQRPAFSPRPVHVAFVVGNLALGQVFL